MMAQLALEVEGGARKTISQSEFQKMPHQTLTVTNPHSKNKSSTKAYRCVPCWIRLEFLPVRN